ncbi:MAG: glycoside hydrolase family 172 protein [Cyclobacteriaceae bacterium]
MKLFFGLMCLVGGTLVLGQIQPVDQLRNGQHLVRSSHDTTGGNNDRIHIPRGETAVIFDEEGPGVIQRIWITIDSRDPHYLRGILLRMFWDDEATPSVEVPVGDFFGCGFQYKHHTPVYVGMSSGGYYSYFPMPFAKRARIEVVNETREEVYAFYYQIGFSKEAVDVANRGYFHAKWTREIMTSTEKNFVALRANGRGHFVGLNMNAQSYGGDLGFLEGDEMIFVDGEKKPSVYGTGTEDYFTSGWYFRDGEYAAAYHGLTMLDGRNGRVTAYRHHVPDAIPFMKSLDVTFEHGDRNSEAVDMSMTTYWYQQEPHGQQEPILVPQLRQTLRRVLPVDVMLRKNIIAPGSHWLGMTTYGPDWKDGMQLVIDAKEAQPCVVKLTGLEETEYDVELFATAGPGYTAFTVAHDNKHVTLADTTSRQVLPLQGVKLTSVKAKNGVAELVLTSQGKGMIGLDGVRLIPHRKFITDWYLIGPFSNLRAHDYERKGLDYAYPPEKEIDFNATYEGLNGQRVKWQRYTEGKAGYEMRLRNFFQPNEMMISYALTFIHSPGDRQVTMLIGTDDAAKAFLNGQEVYRFFDLYRIAAPDQDRVVLNLKKGWNSLLLKLENNFGGYAFYARMIDPGNELVVSAEKEK